MAEPISKSRTDIRKVALISNKVYSFPKTSWKAQFVSRYAVPYQPISSAEWNSSVIWGIAVEMMSRSCERGWSACKYLDNFGPGGACYFRRTRDTTNMPIKMDIMIRASLKPVG